jgi:hypothetical protein
MVWPINVYNKCLLRYNYFILDTFHPDTLYLWHMQPFYEKVIYDAILADNLSIMKLYLFLIYFIVSVDMPLSVIFSNFDNDCY